MKQIFLGIGSNLKNPQKKVLKALKAIREIKRIFEFSSSGLYLTSPVSPIPQNDYVNAVCQFKTDLSPFELFDELERIEILLGKIKKPKEAPRTIDIDLLLFGDLFLDEPSLQIPHPRMLKRLFVLKPLLELQKEIHYPIDKREIQKICLKSWIQKLTLETEESVELL